MSILTEISELMQQGKIPMVKEKVKEAIDAGIEVKSILEEGLLSGMSVIGEKFKNNQIFVPQVLIAARAMSVGVEVLKPYLTDAGVESKGTAIIGSVKGDLHDIGKNLVKIMLEGKGIKVIDLGTDVAPDTFIDAAIEHNAKIICCSALLTTTMGEMKAIIDTAVARGVREKFKIMIGGAPVTKEFCDSIGADCYTSDAASASDAAISFF